MKEIKISVIIPLSSGERLQEKLEQQLSALPHNWEILICSPQRSSCGMELEQRVRWIVTEDGRANCLNAGARHASGDYVWFLHADSILLDHTAEKLAKTMAKNESALYYFDLKFYTKYCHFMMFNAKGVLFRSRCLHTPFGDQAFFMRRELFERLPSYSTEVSYGEDHILVRDYQRYQIPILPIGMKILTSARKYEQNGWLRTNVLHLYLWRKQMREYNAKYRGNDV